MERPLPPVKTLPTMYDLPSESAEEPGLPDEFHLYQPQLLRETFRPKNYDLDNILVATDLNLYYDPRQVNWYKRPDWYAVLGVDRLYQKKELRLSYVVWQEEVSPFIVIELLSPGTEKEDLGETKRKISEPPTKWEVYEQILKVPYYLIYDRYREIFRGFKLNRGRYNELNLTTGYITLEEIQLSLRLWQGSYQKITRQWLRWYDSEGNLIPTTEEIAEIERIIAETERQRAEIERQRAETERQQAEIERQRAETEFQRAERLAAKLRELGIDPNQE
jgi:Uma2 family endonuclease